MFKCTYLFYCDNYAVKQSYHALRFPDLRRMLQEHSTNNINILFYLSER